jgi:hypothetical protein
MVPPSVNIPYEYPYRILRTVNRDVAEKGPKPVFPRLCGGAEFTGRRETCAARMRGEDVLGLAWRYDVGAAEVAPWWETTRVRSTYVAEYICSIEDGHGLTS